MQRCNEKGKYGSHAGEKKANRTVPEEIKRRDILDNV